MKKFFIDVAIGKQEIIDKVRASKTAIHPESVFTDDLDNADAIITDLPSKYYPRNGRTVIVTRDGMGVHRESMGWLDFPDLGSES